MQKSHKAPSGFQVLLCDIIIKEMFDNHSVFLSKNYTMCLVATKQFYANSFRKKHMVVATFFVQRSHKALSRCQVLLYEIIQKESA
jgi:hypothetical protein